MWGGSFERMFGNVFWILFLLVIGIILAKAVKGIDQWSRNNQSPCLTVNAVVKTKRTNVRHHQHANGGDPTGAQGFHTTITTEYYVTFQVESGDRMEFQVSGTEYGMLAQQDEGRLSFQGTRYLGFERKNS